MFYYSPDANMTTRWQRLFSFVELYTFHKITNQFYCHITTAQVPWWVKFLRACSRLFTYLHIDSTYLQTVQKTMCKKNTYIFSVHTVYYKDILSYQYTLYTVCAHFTLCTHLYIVICEGATDYTLYIRLLVQQIVVQRCNRLFICNVVDVHCMVSSDSR